MSNASILERLEQALVAYEREEIARAEFVKCLAASIEALEGVPYSVRLELRHREREIETEGYIQEEGFESTITSARATLKSWIRDLKERYGKGAADRES